MTEQYTMLQNAVLASRQMRTEHFLRTLHENAGNVPKRSQTMQKRNVLNHRLALQHAFVKEEENARHASVRQRQTEAQTRHDARIASRQQTAATHRKSLAKIAKEQKQKQKEKTVHFNDDKETVVETASTDAQAATTQVQASAT